MTSAYDTIKESFNKTKRDISFPPSLLDALTDVERKEVEETIVKLCLKGDRVSYQYIPELKFYNPEEVFVPENMKGLTKYDQSTIYRTLYDKDKNPDYFSRIVENSKTDINTYSMLSLMYCDSDEKSEELYNTLKELSSNSDMHSAIFSLRCEDLPKEDKDSVNLTV